MKMISALVPSPCQRHQGYHHLQPQLGRQILSFIDYPFRQRQRPHSRRRSGGVRRLYSQNPRSRGRRQQIHRGKFDHIVHQFARYRSVNLPLPRAPPPRDRRFEPPVQQETDFSTSRRAISRDFKTILQSEAVHILQQHFESPNPSGR